MFNRSLALLLVGWLALLSSGTARADNCGMACRDGILFPYAQPVCQPPWYVANPWVVVTCKCSPNDPCARPLNRGLDYRRGPVGYAPYPQLCYPRYRDAQQTATGEEVPAPYAP